MIEVPVTHPDLAIPRRWRDDACNVVLWIAGVAILLAPGVAATLTMQWVTLLVAQ